MSEEVCKALSQLLGLTPDEAWWTMGQVETRSSKRMVVFSRRVTTKLGIRRSQEIPHALRKAVFAGIEQRAAAVLRRRSAQS
ncbi:MAG: hypothetical protein HOP35_14010 [Nitrospira sp.]|nr:hypothetical protein [Nitrospira sp.]